MNDPKGNANMQRESWKETVERYRADMLRLARQNEKFSTPAEQPPKAESNDGDKRLSEQQQLQQLFERTEKARLELERLEREREMLDAQVNEKRRLLDELDFEMPPPETVDDTVQFADTLSDDPVETPFDDGRRESVFAQDLKIEADTPLETNERTPTGVENTPRDRFDTSLLTGEADLIVQVFAARQALSIPEAVVTVSRLLNEEGSRELIAVHTTDENGKTPSITLRTPPASLSETAGNAHPYSEYTVDVRKGGYYVNRVSGIQMFEGITTIEPVNLIPLPMGVDGGEDDFVISDYEL